jgi:anthranilate synthase/phosphoribosyltransferase
MYVIIDNYDSFTYNLFQYLSEISSKEFKVFRNDKITVSEVEKMNPEGIIISPGPGRPEEAGISVSIIRHFAGKVPILGVCLGHQCIGAAFGSKIVGAKRIVHGKVEEINLDGKGVFRNITSPSLFTRYHSLVIEKETLPDVLEITATSKDGEIMGIRHKDYDIEGVQIHPESIASANGKKLLKNFLEYKREGINVQKIISRLMEGKNLSYEEAEGFMEELTEGELSNVKIASFLSCLNVKGITPEEIAGAASVLRKKKKSVHFYKPLVDTCGTGGDGYGTFNISSMSALIIAACGAYVAKHGNRGVSSKSGSADFYQQFGMKISLMPEEAEAVLDKTGFVFLFAPIFHGSMKYAAPVRKELKVKTLMNLLGPLANPANASHQVIGVFSDHLCQPIARAAKLLGIKRVMVVHSQDGLDEISICAPTRIVEIDEDGEERDYLLNPLDYNIDSYSLEELKGGSPEKNVHMARALLDGNGNDAVKEAVCLNAGAALYIYGKVQDINEGYRISLDALESGKVKEKLNLIIEETNRF